MTPDVRPLTNGANGAIIIPRCNTRQRAPSAEGDPVKPKLDWVTEEELHIIRACLTYYEAALNKAYREAEDPPVTLAVVHTVETVKRLDQRLLGILYNLQVAIDKYVAPEDTDDDIPF